MKHFHRRILIVEDSPEDRELYRRMLTADPNCVYSIIESETGENGLQLCLTERPDCILLDFHLPDQDGLAFLARVSELFDGFQTYVGISARRFLHSIEM